MALANGITLSLAAVGVRLGIGGALVIYIFQQDGLLGGLLGILLMLVEKVLAVAWLQVLRLFPFAAARSH